MVEQYRLEGPRLNDPTSENIVPEPYRVRKGQADFPMSRDEFNARFRARFADPAFAGKEAQIDQLMDIAWDGYHKGRKSPITQKAGPEFADPDYDLSVDWLATRTAIRHAQARLSKSRWHRAHPPDLRVRQERQDLPG
jgi:hypothetical protein